MNSNTLENFAQNQHLFLKVVQKHSIINYCCFSMVKNKFILIQLDRKDNMEVKNLNKIIKKFKKRQK